MTEENERPGFLQAMKIMKTNFSSLPKRDRYMSHFRTASFIAGMLIYSFYFHGMLSGYGWLRDFLWLAIFCAYLVSDYYHNLYLIRKYRLGDGTPVAKAQESGPQPSHGLTGPGLSTAGGVCILISGLWSLATAMFMLLFGKLVAGSGDTLAFFGNDFELGSMLLACGIVVLISSLFAVWGGISAIKKKNWTISVIGGIFAIMSVFVGLIPGLLGLIGFGLVIMNRQDFEE